MEVEIKETATDFKKDILQFISDNSFPCVMAKAVSKTGYFEVNHHDEIESLSDVKEVLRKLYTFVDRYRQNKEKLSSFALVLTNPAYQSFSCFEKVFWKFLNSLNHIDKQTYPHDSSVGSDPKKDDYSFSVKSEAFFILVLHPQSPRFARRFKYPTIVFNPHRQFENLREKGLFKKIRDVIRLRDKLLQGFINPMLSDFGERSEVFQYLGKVYSPDDSIPLLT